MIRNNGKMSKPSHDDESDEIFEKKQLPLTGRSTDGKMRDILGLADWFLEAAGNRRWSPEKETT